MTKVAMTDHDSHAFVNSICNKLVELDDSIFAAYLISSDGQLLSECVKEQYADELAFEPQVKELLGTWISTCFSVVQNLDRARPPVRFIVISRDTQKGMLIPLSPLRDAGNTSFRFLLKLTLDKKTVALRIYRLVMREASKLFTTEILDPSSLR